MQYFTKREAARIVRCSPRTLNSHIASGRLPVHRLSARMLRISSDDLVVFLTRHRSTPDVAALADESWSAPGLALSSFILLQLAMAALLPAEQITHIIDAAMHALEEMGLDNKDKAAAHLTLRNLFAHRAQLFSPTCPPVVAEAAR